MKCSKCKNIADWFCEDCGDTICEDCTVTEDGNLLAPIDFTKCKMCYDHIEIQTNRSFEKEEQVFLKKEEKRKQRNKKAKERYHSPKQKEKRRLANIEAKKFAREHLKKSLQEDFSLLKLLTKG